MEKFWFYLCDDNVSGPFSTEEIKQKISTSLATQNLLIWARGQRRWLTPTHWEQEHQEILKKREASRNESPNWYVSLNGKNLGPMIQSDLIRYLRSVDSHYMDSVRLWSIGMLNWAKVFEFHQIADELGISRRSHPRAPLNGTVSIIGENEQERIAKALTISMGGIGIAGVSDLKPGSTIKLVIKSNELGAPIHASAQIRYVIGNETGLQFQNLHLEFQARIIDYVKKFKTAEKPVDKAA